MVFTDYEQELINQDRPKTSPKKEPMISRLYVKQVTIAQEAERLRIARELHDRTVQSLIVVLHQLERFSIKKRHSDSGCTAFILEISNDIKKIIREVRRLSSDLRPSILDNLGLIPSIEYLIKEIEYDYALKSSLLVLGEIYRFLPEAEVSIFRIIQEALHNVIRHAEATAVEVSIEFGRDAAIFIISDNGKGIEDIPSKEQLLSRRKLGLAGMVERVELLKGEISLHSCPGRGTRIVVRVPFAVEIID